MCIEEKAREFQVTMIPPTLYHIPRTISSPLVQVLLELNNSCNVKIEEITFGTLKSNEYLTKINPMGTSPAFQDIDLDVKMFESGAILDHLLEQYDIHYQLHPPKASHKGNNIWGTTKGMIKRALKNQSATHKRAKYLQLKQYIIATAYPLVASMYLHSLKESSEQDIDYLNASKEKWINIIGPYLDQSLGDSDYFLGKNISAIDFLVAKPLSNIHQMDMLSLFPKLQSLFDRIRARPTYQLAYESGKLHDPSSMTASVANQLRKLKQQKSSIGNDRIINNTATSEKNVVAKRKHVAMPSQRSSDVGSSIGSDRSARNATVTKFNVTKNADGEAAIEKTMIFSYDDDF